ncbi:hypothetical protein NVP1193O_150 [Vibrio phage 1.193.O._10N.286.52.C6]|nr:hypothetical protein NVP1193O_150 [Vibrio phage 1.193.O._10N.286.52.C6]
MIKTKEDLLNTFIVNDKGILRDKYLALVFEITGCSFISPNNMAEYIMFDDDYTEGGAIEHATCVAYVEGYRELTLADFEPEEVIPESKYKYEKLITDSITELFGLFYEGELYSGITGHKQIKTIEGLLAAHSDEDIYTREEVKWQDVLSEYVVNHKDLTYSCNGNKHIKGFAWENDEDFLEAARIALKVTGELV